MSTIISDIKDNVLTITLNRPDVMNALNKEMLSDLNNAFIDAQSENIRCVVLTGKGRGFCSGQDLSDFSGSFKNALDERYNPLIKRMTELEKPIICGLNGTAAGAGLSLALACDFRIAVESAQLIEIFINVGLVPDSGSSFHLPKITGLSRAYRMCSTAEKLSAKDAYELSLVDILVSEQSVLEIALKKYSEKYAAMPTKALGMIKKLLQYGVTTDLETVLKQEAEFQEIAGNTEDYKEGVSAFLEKRKPIYKGK